MDSTAAPAEAVNAAALDGATASSHMSFLSLFWHADFVVQLVILILVASSLWSGAIIFEKFNKFKGVKFKSERFETNFWSGTPLDQIYEKQKSKPIHPMAAIFIAAMEELSKASNLASHEARQGIKERVGRVMQVAKNRSIDELEARIGFLATVASTAPFVGLFGTVWGIMHSFTSIAASKNISLATVAPGIAEALFATAIGLIAAIPAAVAYNKFSGELDKISNRLDDFSDEFSSLISRQLDEGKL